ncbi:hypothetical protein [Paraferrimonas haliotis]|uniref:hypothetical protein n=1 Tax=Paraferrimonas haliotis TaxID=2013866 RepID=UPI000BA9AB73|nr:hypothetical protein [Paraferrimonas haliotis]
MLGRYTSRRDRIEFQCECGNVVKISPYGFLQTEKCHACREPVAPRKTHSSKTSSRLAMDGEELPLKLMALSSTPLISCP